MGSERSAEQGKRAARTAPPRQTVKLGQDGETAAEAFLATQGWVTLARNWRGKRGELDRIVGRGAALRFVEVKVRDVSDPWAEEAWSVAQRLRARQAAEQWLARSEAPPCDDLGFLLVLAASDGNSWSFRVIDVDL